MDALTPLEKKVLEIVDEDIGELFRECVRKNGPGSFALGLPLQMHMARYLKAAVEESRLKRDHHGGD